MVRLHPFFDSRYIHFTLIVVFHRSEGTAETIFTTALIMDIIYCGTIMSIKYVK